MFQIANGILLAALVFSLVHIFCCILSNLAELLIKLIKFEKKPKTFLLFDGKTNEFIEMKATSVDSILYALSGPLDQIEIWYLYEAYDVNNVDTFKLVACKDGSEPLAPVE